MSSMRKILFLISASLLSIVNAETLKGVFVTNDQGALYQDTVITCIDGIIIDVSSENAVYRNLVEYYFNSIENLNKYGELYVELEVSEYLPIDKVKYPKDHWDATATVQQVILSSFEQVEIDKCLSKS